MRLCKPAERELKGVEYESDVGSRDAAEAGHVCFVVTSSGASSVHIYSMIGLLVFVFNPSINNLSTSNSVM